MQTTHHTVNGIDTNALRGLAAAITADAREGIARFEVSTAWKGGAKSETRVDTWEIGGRRRPRGFTISTDEPPELCGEGVAPNPQEVLMAGLDACMMVGYVAGCELRGIELESLEIRARGELDLRGFLGIDPSVKPGYDELRYTVRIRGSGTPDQFREIHETVMATSPNFFNLSRPITLKPTLIVE